MTITVNPPSASSGLVLVTNSVGGDQNLYYATVPNATAGQLIAVTYNGNPVVGGGNPSLAAIPNITLSNIPTGQVYFYMGGNTGTAAGSNYGAFTYGSSPSPVSNTCFPAKTPIVTDQGVVAIEKLDKDVNTIRGNPIVAITKTVNPNKYLVCFEKDALATNVPSKKTVMSKNHSVFYKGKMNKTTFENPAFLEILSSMML